MFWRIWAPLAGVELQLRPAVRQRDRPQPHHIAKSRLGIRICSHQPCRGFGLDHRGGAGRGLRQFGIDAVCGLHLGVGNGVDRDGSLHRGLSRGIAHVDQVPRLRRGVLRNRHGLVERLVIRRNARHVHRVPRQQNLLKLLWVGQGSARHVHAGDRLNLCVEALEPRPPDPARG